MPLENEMYHQPLNLVDPLKEWTFSLLLGTCWKTQIKGPTLGFFDNIRLAW